MKLRREVGFAKAVCDLRIGQLITSPEFVPALVLGGGGSVWLAERTDVEARAAVVGDYLFIVGPFVGVVVAGLALVITLLSSEYLTSLRAEKPRGIVPFLQPFVFAVGVQTGTLLACVIYRAAAPLWSLRIEHAFFYGLSFLFVFSCLEIVAVARNLVAHGVTRSAGADLRTPKQASADTSQREVS